MPAPTSITSSNVGQPLGSKCFYRVHNNTSDLQSTVVESDYAKCGFNEGDLAFCDERRGDKTFTKYLKAAKKYLRNDLKCHTNSDEAYFLDIDCKAFIESFGNEFAEEQIKAITSIEIGGNAKIANNAKCVKQTITSPYWGNASTFGTALTIVSVLVFSMI
jgi:hypothetical protein